MNERPQRIPFTRPIHVTAEALGSKARRLQAGNVSRGGMFVRTDEELPAGTRVGLSLEAKGKVFPFAEAEVVWCSDAETWKKKGRAPGFGLRFVRFLHPRSEKLIDFLTAKAPVAAPAPVPVPVPAKTAAIPSIPPLDFASRPISDLGGTDASSPAWADSAPRSDAVGGAGPQRAEKLSEAPLRSDLMPEDPLPEDPGEEDDVPELEDPDGWSRIATAVGLIAVLVIVGGGMLYVVSRSAGSLHAAANPESVTESAAPASEDTVAVQAATSEPSSDAKRDSPAEVTADSNPGAARKLEPTASETPAGKHPTVVAPAAESAAVSPTTAATVRAPEPAASPRPAAPPQEPPVHTVTLASGAARWVEIQEGSSSVEVQLDLAYGARINQVFQLSNPPRVVLDLVGDVPKSGEKLDGAGAHVTGVRTGARPDGTRVVLDMAGPIASIQALDHGVRITLP